MKASSCTRDQTLIERKAARSFFPILKGDTQKPEPQRTPSNKWLFPPVLWALTLTCRCRWWLHSAPRQRPQNKVMEGGLEETFMLGRKELDVLTPREHSPQGRGMLSMAGGGTHPNTSHSTAQEMQLCRSSWVKFDGPYYKLGQGR